MLTTTFKKRALLLGLLLSVVGCGIFSDDKDIPQGKRISVLNTKETSQIRMNEADTVVLPEASESADWTQTGGSATHVGGVLSAMVGDPKQIWKESFGEGSSKRKLLITSPIVYNQKVYVQDVAGTVSAFDLQNGDKQWKHKIKPQVKNEADAGINGVGLAAGSDRIFALTGFGSVVALNAHDGEEIWRKEMRTPLRTAPTLCRDKLLVQTLDNRLVAYQASDGEELWQYKVPAEDTVLAGGAAPACDDQKDLVVAAFSNGELEALNLNAGYPLWSVPVLNRMTVNSATEINALKAAPVIAGDYVYAIGHNDNLSAVSYRTGEKIWERRLGGVNMPWLAGNTLFVLTNTNEVTALDAQTGQTLWTTPLLEEYDVKERNSIWLSGPVLAGRYLLVGASNGKLYRLSAQNGAVSDQVDTGYSLAAAPVVADRSLVFITDNARVIVYR
jgi:outer membrane protein assembly factor BamB